MERFKIDYFEKEHGADSFPEFRSLTREEANHLLASLKRRLGLPDESSAQDVLHTIERRSVDVDVSGATEDAFDLRSVLGLLGFSAEKVFLNWHRFDRIDEFGLEDLCNSFSDVFYPPADDLEILDSNLRWLVSVRHYGAVKALELSGK